MSGGIMMGKYGIALTTFENEQQAKPIIDEIIKCKLAACVQEIMIKSHYTWKGELCREDEVLVLFKTRKDLYPELERKLLEIHPYDTPEILFVDAEKGSAAYLAWVEEQTRNQPT
jgi:periplasmic divalent cation tolerance protein